MIPVLSREQMRAFDRHAIDDCGVPGLVLMENAGRGATEAIAREIPTGSITVVCGAGNNGGDGFVIARRLTTLGRAVRVCLAAHADKLGGDALANYRAWRGIGGAVVELPDDAALPLLEDCLSGAAGVVDALFGTGLDRDIAGRHRAIVERVNAAQARRVAVDVPSGIHANTGAVLGVAVRADTTVTFAHVKLGLVTTAGAEHAGRVEVVDIGVPASLVQHTGHAARIIESADAARALGRRALATHKASAGRVFAIAGSAGKTGAALLVARGALRAGAGLVTICTFPEAADAVDARALEEMSARIDPARIEDSLDELLANVDVVAIGPGLGLDARARTVVDHVVLRWSGVKVVDADAITSFKGRAAELARAAGEVILTPHPAELGRLLDCSARDVERDRWAALARAVDLTRAVVLLKGPRTLVGAPGELPVVNTSGTPALATGGAGDALSGITAALAAHLTPFDAAWSAAHVHGRSAELWSTRTGADRGMLAHEIADGVPGAIASLSDARDRDR